MTVMTYAAWIDLGGDSSIPSGVVMGRVAAAEALIAEELDREFDLIERTEMVKAWPKGTAYPRATPIASVPVGSAYSIYDANTLLNVWWFDITVTNPFETWLWDDAYPHDRPMVSVKYTGGYDVDSMPMTLKVAIVMLATAMAATPVVAAVGVTSKSVGDVSIGQKAGSAQSILDGWVPGLWGMIKRFRRREL